MFIICTLLPYVCLPFLCWVKFCIGCFRQFFFIWKTKKWSLVALDRLSSYAVTTEWKFARADSALVVLDKWSSYKGDHLNRFYCMFSCSMYYCDSSYIKPFLTTIPTQLGANLSFFFFLAHCRVYFPISWELLKLFSWKFAQILFLLLWQSQKRRSCCLVLVAFLLYFGSHFRLLVHCLRNP